MGRLSRGTGLGYVTNTTSVVTDYYSMLLTLQLHTINLSLQLEYTLAHLRRHFQLANTFSRSGFTYQALSAPLTVSIAPLRIVRTALETLHLLLLHSLYVSVQRPGLLTLGPSTYQTCSCSSSSCTDSSTPSPRPVSAARDFRSVSVAPQRHPSPRSHGS
jgi:hypothetical protein